MDPPDAAWSLEFVWMHCLQGSLRTPGVERDSGDFVDWRPLAGQLFLLRSGYGAGAELLAIGAGAGTGQGSEERVCDEDGMKRG